MVILQDTREQRPWEFPGCAVRQATLSTGDYSVLGYEQTACIERKSLHDLACCLSGDFKRFNQQLNRLDSMRALVLVEGSLDELMMPTRAKGVHYAKLLPRLTKVFLEHKTPIVFAGSVECARNLAKWWLRGIAEGAKDV